MEGGKKEKRQGKGVQKCEAGGQKEVILAQRLEGDERLSHGDIWARAFSADGTARSKVSMCRVCCREEYFLMGDPWEKSPT